MLKKLILQALPHLPLPCAIFKHRLGFTEVSHRTWEVLHPTQTSRAPICLCLLVLHDLLQLKSVGLSSVTAFSVAADY